MRQRLTCEGKEAYDLSLLGKLTLHDLRIQLDGLTLGKNSGGEQILTVSRPQAPAKPGSRY